MELLWIFNKNKLRILHSLYNCQKNLQCCVLLENLGISKHLLSYHLRTLIQHSFVYEVKKGRRKIYQIPEDKMVKVESILSLMEMI
jgi:DNA-binding transcriptional regulator GbsR (MarR family)